MAIELTEAQKEISRLISSQVSEVLRTELANLKESTPSEEIIAKLQERAAEGEKIRENLTECMAHTGKFAELAEATALFEEGEQGDLAFIELAGKLSKGHLLKAEEATVEEAEGKQAQPEDSLETVAKILRGI